MAEPESRPLHPLFFALVALILALVLSVAYTTYSVTTSQHRFCATIGLVGQQKPPPGDPAKNPSRAYLQELHQHFTALYHSLGCH